MSELGTRQISHVGLHVADLDRSLGYYQGLLGLELLDRAERSGPQADAILGREGVRFERALLRLPESNAYLELIDYGDQAGKPVDPLHGNVGTCHVAFYTDDLDETWATLKAAGSELQGEVTVIEGGVFDGGKVIYCTDPDGIRVEFLQGPAYLDGSVRDPDAVPKLTRANETSHAGIHVSDLERSCRFWVDVLGLEVAGKWVADDIGTRKVIGEPTADLNMAMLRMPGVNAFIEVIEYQNTPGRTTVDPDHFNPSTCHLAFYVDDVDRTLAALEAAGGSRVSAAPVEATEGPFAGGKVVYAADPDGIRVELIESDRFLDGSSRTAETASG